jgi:copper(I)-binding protein
MKRRSLLAVGIAMALSAALPAAAQGVTTDNLEISGAFARASPMVARAGAGFMTITSKGAPDSLIAFKSDICDRPELHTHVNDNGVMRMRQIDAIEIPAGGKATLEPGGLHLMFIDLREPLQEGQTITATLVFAKAGEVEITIPVKGPGAMH